MSVASVAGAPPSSARRGQRCGSGRRLSDPEWPSCWWSRSALRGHDVHVGQLSGAGVQRSVLGSGARRSTACRRASPSEPRSPPTPRGSACSGDTGHRRLQKIPEGTATAIPMEAAEAQPHPAVLGRPCRAARRSPSGRSSPIPWFSRSRPAGLLVRIRCGGNVGARGGGAVATDVPPRPPQAGGGRLLRGRRADGAARCDTRGLAGE